MLVIQYLALEAALPRHSGGGRNPGFLSLHWTPAFAGVTVLVDGNLLLNSITCNTAQIAIRSRYISMPHADGAC